LTLTPALPVTPGWPSGLRTVALSKSPTPTTTPR
jgi:hypothetical protein